MFLFPLFQISIGFLFLSSECGVQVKERSDRSAHKRAPRRRIAPPTHRAPCILPSHPRPRPCLVVACEEVGWRAAKKNPRLFPTVRVHRLLVVVTRLLHASTESMSTAPTAGGAYTGPRAERTRRLAPPAPLSPQPAPCALGVEAIAAGGEGSPRGRTPPRSTPVSLGVQGLPRAFARVLPSPGKEPP